MVKKKTAWPRRIVEIPSATRDPRSDDDPMATQKISAATLEEALRRTKSGLRRAVRESSPEIDLAGDRDPLAESPASLSDPVITVKEEEVSEEELLGPEPPRATPIPRTRGAAHVVTPSSAAPVQVVSAAGAPASTRQLRVVLGFVVALLTTLALAIGWFIGRASR